MKTKDLHKIGFVPSKTLSTRAQLNSGPRPPTPGPAARPAYVFAAIVAATIAAYYPSLRGALLWDDTSHVTPPALQSLHGLWRIWFSLGATQQYYPLLHSAFWLEHRLWGDAVLGYHLTNVLLHAAAACLVVLILRRLALPGAWLAGFIFALHPVCVEAVAWISEQKSTLSAVFYLAAALAYLNFDRTRRRPLYAAALALFILALLTKTVTATLPAALLVILWWQRGRLRLRRDVRPLLPWFALSAAAGLTTAWVERTYIGAQGADFALTLTQRFLLAGRALCFYAAKLIFPANLIFTYPHWRLDPAIWWQWLYPAAVLAAAVALIVLARRRRGPLAAFLFFVGTLFPALGFVNVYPFVFSYVADHFQYLATLGLIVPAAYLLTRLPPPAKLAVPGVILLTFAALTFRQSANYRDSMTLYRATLARNPESWMAHNNLGVALVNSGHVDDAIAEYQAALRVNPNDVEAHNNLGNALGRIPGRLPDAIAEFQTALRMRPGFAEAHHNLGTAWSRVPGRLPDAIAEFQTALRINPNNADAHNELGIALLQAGRLPDAIAEFQAALRVNPADAQAHGNLGNALMQMPGRLPDAIAELQAALRVSPNEAPAHNSLGIAFAQSGRLPDAIAEFQTALRLNPGFIPARQNLARAEAHP